jgi:hypothetical protein
VVPCPQLCPPGTFAPAGSWRCSPCAAGHYVDKPMAGSCRACAPGQYAPPPAESLGPSSLTLTVGLFTRGASSCSACPVGYSSGGSVKKRSGGGGASQCTLCAPGTSQAMAGRGYCIACATGMFRPAPPSARFNHARKDDDNAHLMCTECPAGYQPVGYIVSKRQQYIVHRITCAL